jgi:hypothetical protein
MARAVIVSESHRSVPTLTRGSNACIRCEATCGTCRTVCARWRTTCAKKKRKSRVGTEGGTTLRTAHSARTLSRPRSTVYAARGRS